MSPGRPGRRQRRPLPPGQHLATPGASAGRTAVERRSAAALVFVHQLPVWLLPAVLLGLLVSGLGVRGAVGAAALCGVAAVLMLLAFVSWPRLAAGGRLWRAAAIGCVLAAAVVQAAR